MKELLLPDYENSVVNLSCSVLKYFLVHPPHTSLPLIDSLLEKNFRHVVVLVLDGMGDAVLKEHMCPNDFFRRNRVGRIFSTFPPTTVAATTALLSGRYPIETGWLGWDCYFPALDENIVYFRNTNQQGDKVFHTDVAKQYYPYSNICEQIISMGEQAYFSSPYIEPYPQSFSNVCQRVHSLCNKEEKSFIYAYWGEPDHVIHYHGGKSDAVKTVLTELQQQVEQLSAVLEDTLLIVTADHGHIDSRGVMITEYEDICQCLQRMPSIEPRAMNLFVKEEKKELFEERFDRHFGRDYLLMSKQEVLNSGLFGPAVPRELVRCMLGDYLGVATGDLTVYNVKKDWEQFKSTHGGMTAEELLVPIIAVECR